MTMTRRNESPPLSERTCLMPAAPNNSSSSLKTISEGSLELGTLGSEPMDACEPSSSEDASFVLSSHKPRSYYTSYRVALTGILALCVAFRLLRVSDDHVVSRDDGSLSYWDGETHHLWEEFASSGAAAGLLGTTTHHDNTQSVEMTISTTTKAGGRLLYFNESSAFAMLNPLEADFFYYQQGWEAQINQALCAVATTAALLNSLRDVSPQFDLPMDPVYEPFPWATQKELLASAVDNPCVRDALGGNMNNAAAVYHMGLGLTMVPRLANCFLEGNGYLAKGHPAVPSDDENASAAMKSLVVAALKDPASRVLFNYDRGGIGQGPLGHGHWSPLGGYHEHSDSFLVMDVAKYKHPMVWVSWKDLWSGAATVDNCGEMLSFDDIDWTAGFAGVWEYIETRCVPGHRGFVVVERF